MVLIFFYLLMFFRFFLSKESTNQVADKVQAQLREKQRKLLELQKSKLELELMATKQQIEEQEREMTKVVGVGNASSMAVPNKLNNSAHIASTILGPSRTLVNNHPIIPPQVIATNVQ